VIDHFLKDIEDGRYGGFPMAGVRLVPLQNPAYRSFLKLPDNDQGARVDSLLPIPTTEKLIQPDDVLLRVGVTLIEYLVNTSALRHPRTLLCAAPLKIPNADGAPARVFAIEGLSV